MGAGCGLGANLSPYGFQKSIKIRSWRRLGASWSRLGGLLGRLGGIFRPLGAILGPLGHILVPLGPSSRHPGGVLGLKNPREPLTPGAVAEVQGPLLRIFQDFPVCISLVYTEEMEVRKEKRRKGRLEYRTPYAMRRHKAWRGGSNSAAKLRTRHHAWNTSNKTAHPQAYTAQKTIRRPTSK